MGVFPCPPGFCCSQGRGTAATATSRRARPPADVFCRRQPAQKTMAAGSRLGDRTAKEHRGRPRCRADTSRWPRRPSPGGDAARSREQTATHQTPGNRRQPATRTAAVESGTPARSQPQAHQHPGRPRRGSPAGAARAGGGRARPFKRPDGLSHPNFFPYPTAVAAAPATARPSVVPGLLPAAVLAGREQSLPVLPLWCWSLLDQPQLRSPRRGLTARGVLNARASRLLHRPVGGAARVRAHERRHRIPPRRLLQISVNRHKTSPFAYPSLPYQGGAEQPTRRGRKMALGQGHR